MTTNRNLNRQRRRGLELALDDPDREIDYSDPTLYPSFPENPQASSLLGSSTPIQKNPQTKKKAPDGLSDMEQRIVNLHKRNPAVIDNDQILDVEIWMQEGLQDVLRSGSVDKFLHWLMFEASPAGTIERARRSLTSDKHGPPRLQQSENARHSRAAKERVWKQHWSIKDGGTVRTEHELEKFDRRDGIDRHGHPPFE